MIRAYIGIGSNLDNPIKQVKNAFSELARLAKTQLICYSSLYQSAPVGNENQPDFVNAVAFISTELQPQMLLNELQSIEYKYGRIDKTQRNMPRILDLDLLLYGNEEMNLPNLIIPHPRLAERAFVLYPLAEIAPNLILPNRVPIKQLLRASPQLRIEKLSIEEYEKPLHNI